jgi:glycosyltransferase involved in cell wall biosynthesis
MNGSRVSVITATRNAVALLRENAPDLLQRLGDGDEWLIQDSASDDATAQYVAELSDPRVRLESKQDSGIYEAFNRALNRVQGHFVLFLGADDRLLIALDEIRHRLSHPATIYYGDVVLEQSRQRYAGPFTGKRLARTNICHQAIFYPKTAFASRRYDTHYPIQADWVFNMDCWQDRSLAFEYLDCAVASFNDHSGLSSRFVDIAFQRDYPQILWRHFPLRDCLMPWIVHTVGNACRSILRRPMPIERKRRGLIWE